MSKLLNLDELNKVEKPLSREKNRKTYEYLLSQCHAKIKEYNKVHRSKFCYYKPPIYLIGYPVYNYFDVINYLMEELNANGLYTSLTENGIYICWDSNVLNMDRYQQAIQRNEPPPPHIEEVMVRKSESKPKIKKRGKGSASETPLVSILCLNDDLIPVNLSSHT